MILVLDGCLVNMDNVSSIEVTSKNDDGTLGILIKPLDININIKEKNWGALIKALGNNEKLFVLD